MPPIKYVSGYQTSKDIEAVLGCNSRTPELVVGDLRGQVGAARLGEKRFQEMMDRYGKETILASYEQLFAMTEAKVRAEIASWPDGTGEGERFVDSDGIDLDKPVRLHVRIEKKAIICFSISLEAPTRPRGEYPPHHRAGGLLLSPHLPDGPGAGH